MKEKLELIEKLITCSNVAIRKNSNSAVLIDNIILGYCIKNGKCEFDYKVAGAVNIDYDLINYAGQVYGFDPSALPGPGGQSITILGEDSKVFIINKNGTITIPYFCHQIITNNLQRVDLDSETTTFINNALTELASILDIIPQITSYKSYNDSYVANNPKIQQQIVETKQKIIEFDKHVRDLKLAVDSFNIKDSITSLSPQQRSHILQKIWGSSDSDSANIISSIKECGFNPNYTDNQGRSLLNKALTNNDRALFDLLIANNINFNGYIGNKTSFHIILQSGNNNFISKMFAANQDFSKSLLGVALQDDNISLATAFAQKVELAKTKYSGYPLLQLALEQNQYKASKQILTTCPEAINLVNNNGLSVLASAVLQGNKTGVDLLKTFGSDLDLEVKKAINGKYIQYFAKLLYKFNTYETKLSR
jgi:hypothetical protein